MELTSQGATEAVRSAQVETRYSEIRARVFGRPDWNALERAAVGKPKVSFRLDIDFNRAAYTTAYDFLVELNQVFSRKILPIRIANGCINIIAAFESATDYLGVDFRERILHDEEYQDILSSYAVVAVDTLSFPASLEYPDTHFVIDYLGRPTIA